MRGETREAREAREEREVNTEKSGKFLRTSEAADRLGVDTGTVVRYIKNGLLPAVTTGGGHYRIQAADVERFQAGIRGQGYGPGNSYGHGHAHTPEGAVVIAAVNQKGGVGKTTATANLAVLLAQAGMRVLAVDLDPQGHLTLSLGHDPDSLASTIYDALRDADLDPETIIVETPFGPDLAPNNIMSSVAEEQLRGKFTWALCLAKVLARVRRHYDYILLDSGPNMGVLTVNCLCAADFVIIPTQMELLSVQGLNLLLGRIDEARRENPGLTIAGAVGMMVQPINANRAVEGSLRLALGKHNIRVFETTIKRASKFADVANERGVLVDALPRSEHAEAYRRLLAEILLVVGGRAAEALNNEKRGTQQGATPAAGSSTKGSRTAGAKVGVA